MFTYDANGSTFTNANAPGTTQYAWDFENRLTSVVLPGSGGTVTFKYDPFGRRIQKSSPNGTTNFLYDGANVIEEVDSSGNLLGRYAQGVGIDEPLAELSSGTSAFYEVDGLGSITSLSGTTGTLSNTYGYDAFGNTAALAGSFVNSYRYTGRDYDPETGLQYSRARYYQPQIGRFLSEDPVGFRAGVNFYEYVHNNSPNRLDPTGKQSFKTGMFCEREGTCSIHLTCPPTHGTEFTHCDVTTRNSHLYTTYGAGPKGGSSVWWGSTLDAGKVAPDGKGNPPGPNTWFYTLFPCDKLNCIPVATERIHEAKLPYSAFLINSNTAAYLMLKACGLDWVSFPSQAWGANTPLWLVGKRF